MTARDLIFAERRRQIEVEGWTPEHDDAHTEGELLRAAILYHRHGTGWGIPYHADGTPRWWPWEPKWWKPKDRRSDLIRAGALCLAEEERLSRKFRATIAAGTSAVFNNAEVQRKLGAIIRDLEALPNPTV